MNVERLFLKFEENWQKILNHTEKDKEEYLKSLINKVNINNPHYIKSLPTFYFYNLVKEKANTFLDEIGFECHRCLESCCYFTYSAFINKEVGLQIYKEDYELLKNANGDLNGYIEHSDFAYSNLLLIQKDTEIQGTVDYGFIDVIKRKDKYQCYYFNENSRECKIRRERPLVCYLYPFRFRKRQEDLDILIFINCGYFKNKLDLKKKIPEIYSYWEFWIALALFLKYITFYGRERK